MSLTAEQRTILKERVDRTRRKRLRIRHPGDPRSFCEAITERHTKCKNYAQDGSHYCGQHRAWL